MITRKKLNQYLTGFYNVGDFDDYCENGLQVEGKDEIKRIVFGVSFNQPFLQEALKHNPDAIIVHHGIFQQGHFKLKDHLKQKVKTLLENDISLFGLHLPMDGHPEIGHNALILKSLSAENVEPFELGYKGQNAKKYSLNQIIDILHKQLHPENHIYKDVEKENAIFSISRKYGFTILDNGPEIPEKIAVITGGSSGYYEKAINKGIDTFFGGDIKEKIPALSMETKTNFVNLGHYFSEKPGILALQTRIQEKFGIETIYIEIPNPV